MIASGLRRWLLAAALCLGLAGAAGCGDEALEACMDRCDQSGAGLGTCFDVCRASCDDTERMIGLGPEACRRMHTGSALASR